MGQQGVWGALQAMALSLLLLILVGGGYAAAQEGDEGSDIPAPLLNTTNEHFASAEQNKTWIAEVQGNTTTTATTIPPDPSKCPEKCYCDPGFLRVDCSNASFLEIPGSIPFEVEHLDFSHNALQSLSAQAFGELPNLQVLDLSDNQISHVDQDCFKGLDVLEDLNLHSNLLNNGNELIQALPRSLHMLNISLNKVQDLDSVIAYNETPSSSFSSLEVLPQYSFPNLTVLDISYNQLGNFPHLHRFPEISEVHIHHNQIRKLTKDFSQIHMSNSTSQQVEKDNSVSHDISIFRSTAAFIFPSITKLDVSANGIEDIDQGFFQAYPNLETLNLSGNKLVDLSYIWAEEASVVHSLSSLQYLDVSNNAFEHLPNYMFSSCCANLTTLNLSHQQQLRHISSDSFKGLNAVENLALSHCPVLSYIHAGALSPMPHLHHIDLSYTAIKSIHRTFLPSSLIGNGINLEGVLLNCSCEILWMQDLNSSAIDQQFQNVSCQNDDGELELVSEVSLQNCSSPATILTDPVSYHLEYEIGGSAMFDCSVEGQPLPHVTWIASKSKLIYTYHPAFLDHHQLLDPGDPDFHKDHYWHGVSKYFNDVPLKDRVYVLQNGSLYIDYITRMDAGQYECRAENDHGNSSLLVTVVLDYNAILETQIWCLVIGFGSAISFLLIGIIAGFLRWVSHFCSAKEKEKRRSIKELLITISEYKSEKVDVFRAYKDAKLDKISAFKNHKIDKLRTYKQDTVTNILQHMSHMREHYQGQMAKIKDNYGEQVDRLRDNYSQHITKIKDYRTEKVVRIRDQYQGQALKIRDYGASQMQRLREQYKLQQQHMLKLLELLDIGNCMSVIEAECMRTESMLFDPNITFDLDDERSNPVPLDTPLSSPSLDGGDSEYMTACSVSDDPAAAAAVSVSPRKSPRRVDTRPRRRESSSSSDLNLDHSILTANLDPEIQQILLESQPPARPPRKHRRRKKQRPPCVEQCQRKVTTVSHHREPQEASQKQPPQDENGRLLADQSYHHHKPKDGAVKSRRVEEQCQCNVTVSHHREPQEASQKAKSQDDNNGKALADQSYHHHHKLKDGAVKSSKKRQHHQHKSPADEHQLLQRKHKEDSAVNKKETNEKCKDKADSCSVLVMDSSYNGPHNIGKIQNEKDIPNAESIV